MTKTAAKQAQLPSSSQDNSTGSDNVLTLAAQFGLVGLEPIFNVVETLLWTGQVSGERPASAIIIAPIGSGKTSVMEKMKTDTAEFLSDFTSQNARPIIRNDKLSHIMIGDFLSVLGHKTGTVMLSLNILSKMTGEEILSDPWTGEPIRPGRKIGVITAIPPSGLNDRKMQKLLWDSGFASRFILIRYNYSEETIRRIHEFIESDAYTKTRPVQLNVERGQVAVDIPPSISHQINILSRSISHDPIGARAHHHLRALVKARARMRKADKANEDDYMAVEHMSDFFTKQGRRI